MLDPTEREQAGKFKRERLRLDYVFIHARLRELLADYVNANPAQLQIHRTQFGKPYLPDFPDVKFNLSHTGDRMAVAIALDCELGIDIELNKHRHTLPALVDKCFAESEKHYWLGLPEVEKSQVFYRFWTRKEAFVKATGRGIALGLNNCVVDVHYPDRFLSIPSAFGTPADWTIHEFNIGESICGALVARAKLGFLIDC